MNYFPPIKQFFSVVYAFLKAFPKKSRSNEPAIATKKATKLNPVIAIPKIRFAKKPPMSAPTIPKRVDPIRSLLLGD